MRLARPEYIDAVQEPPPQTAQRCEARSNLILENVSWETYKQLLAEMGDCDRRTLQIAYNQGVLEIIMPSGRHETEEQLLERMVNTLTEELNLRVKGFASTTLNLEDINAGAEPDSCYYIQNVDIIRGRTVDLAILLRSRCANDPPPDLVIEVDITSSTVDLTFADSEECRKFGAIWDKLSELTNCKKGNIAVNEILG